MARLSEFYYIYSLYYRRWEAIRYSDVEWDNDVHWFLPSNVEILPNLNNV